MIVPEGDSGGMGTGETEQGSRINLWLHHLQQMDLRSKIAN